MVCASDKLPENIEGTFPLAIAWACGKAVEYAKKQGFWELEHPGDFGLQVGTKMALVMTELGEALEAFRKGGLRGKSEVCSVSNKQPLTCVEEELADALIRIFDLAGMLELDLGDAVVSKMTHNETREWRHGKNF